MKILNGNLRLEDILKGGKKLRKFKQVSLRNHPEKDREELLNEKYTDKY